MSCVGVEPQIENAPDAVSMDNFKGKIEFKNVWFAYKDEDWVLKDVSFTVEPGQRVAFVGATVAGQKREACPAARATRRAPTPSGASATMRRSLA